MAESGWWLRADRASAPIESVRGRRVLPRDGVAVVQPRDLVQCHAQTQCQPEKNAHLGAQRNHIRHTEHKMSDQPDAQAARQRSMLAGKSRA